jgi:hypothetical protein
LATSPLRMMTGDIFQQNPCGHSPYVTSSLTRGRVSPLWTCLALSSILIAHITCYWKFLPVHYIQVFCQYRLCKANHVYLTYLMLQRQPSHLNGRKLDRLQVYASYIFYAQHCLVLRCEHVLSYDFVWLLLVACIILLCDRIHAERWKQCENRGPVRISENSQWCGEPCFTGAAILRGRCLPLIPRRDKRKSLLIWWVSYGRYASFRVRVRITLRLALYHQSVRLGDNPLRLTTINSFFQLDTCCHSPYITSPLTRGWVCRLQLLLVLASVVILRSESREIHDYILVPPIRDSLQLGGSVICIYIAWKQGDPVITPGTVFPFCRILRLARLWWRYSTPPPRATQTTGSPYIAPGRTAHKTSLSLLRVLSLPRKQRVHRAVP